VSDMHVAGAARGLIDFATLKEVVPLEDLALEGKLETDLRWDTRMSYIEQERYDQVDLEGTLMVQDVLVEAPDIPVPVELSKLHMQFTPRVVELLGLDLMLGSSDLHLDGELSNFIPYVFDGQVVSGSVNLSSQLLDANELFAGKNGGTFRGCGQPQAIPCCPCPPIPWHSPPGSGFRKISALPWPWI
jgi:hypothetical protein